MLWRGKPGWFDDRRDQVGGGGTDGVHRVIVGGRTIELEFDARMRTVRFQGQVIALREGNVLLLDNVDRPNGATVAGLVRVDSPLSGGPARQSGANEDPITATIRRSSKLYEFLRCDLSSGNSDPNMKQRLMYCAQVRPK